MCLLPDMHMFHFEWYFITLLFPSRPLFSCLVQILAIEDLREVSALYLTLIFLEEDFLNFTERIRSDICTFHVYYSIYCTL